MAVTLYSGFKECEKIVAPFLDNRINPENFGHQAHIRLAYDLLLVTDFPHALTCFCTCVRVLASRAGVPEKFHMTTTVAFIALIAEKMRNMGAQDLCSKKFDYFINRHSELLDKNLLGSWYGDDELASERARETFLLPKNIRPFA